MGAVLLTRPKTTGHNHHYTRDHTVKTGLQVIPCCAFDCTRLSSVCGRMQGEACIKCVGVQDDCSWCCRQRLLHKLGAAATKQELTGSSQSASRQEVS